MRLGLFGAVMVFVFQSVALHASENPAEDWEQQAAEALPTWRRPQPGEHEAQRESMLALMTPLCVENQQMPLPSPKAQLIDLFQHLFDPSIIAEPIHSDKQVLEGWRCLYASLLEGQSLHVRGFSEEGIIKQLRAIWMVVGIHHKSLSRNAKGYFEQVMRFEQDVNGEL
ncbi:MAG: hypothetical protein ACK5VW_02175 [Holosporales bacterium]